jgi:hypothetical protein
MKQKENKNEVSITVTRKEFSKGGSLSCRTKNENKNEVQLIVKEDDNEIEVSPIVKVNMNEKLDVNGTIITLNDLLSLVNVAKPKGAKSTKILPMIIRKYAYAVEAREKLQQLLDGVNELTEKYNIQTQGDTIVSSNDVLWSVFAYFKIDSRERLSKGIEVADEYIQDIREEYEKSVRASCCA